jgi:kinesin family protein 13
LQEELIKANMLVREANEMSNEMNKQTLFNVTLQISPLNLKLNRNVSLIIIIIDFS